MFSANLHVSRLSQFSQLLYEIDINVVIRKLRLREIQKICQAHNEHILKLGLKFKSAIFGLFVDVDTLSNLV